MLDVMLLSAVLTMQDDATSQPMEEQVEHHEPEGVTGKAVWDGRRLVDWLPEVVAELNKVRLPYNINSFSQLAAETVLREGGTDLETKRQTIIDERGRLEGALATIRGITPFRSDANFILFRTEIPSGEVFTALKEKGVLVRNLDAPGPLCNCLRVTVGTAVENAAFLNALTAICI